MRTGRTGKGTGKSYKKRTGSGTSSTRSRGRSGDASPQSKRGGDAKALPVDIAAATAGMSPEDAAAYVRVQLLGSYADNMTERSSKSSNSKRAAAERKKPAPKKSNRASAAKTSSTKPAPAPSSAPSGKQRAKSDSAKSRKSTEPSSGSRSGSAPAAKRAPRRGGKESSRIRTATPEARPAKRSDVAVKKAVAPTSGSAEAVPALGSGRVMVINCAGDDECRIAILFERKLEEFFIERSSSISHVGNIYKGAVTNVEPGIQAAFIDFGLPKQGFLHISDVQPQYFSGPNKEPEGVGQKVPRRDRPPIQKCFRRGQEVIVQVIKEGLGTKGPTLSTYLSIPGRYLVMMPGMTRLGVSRKIEDEESRRKMRSVLSELALPKDMGFILRTAGEGHTKRDLQRDLTYLDRLWKLVVQRVKTARAPAELYRESDLVTRTIRDVFTVDFERIIVDSQETAKQAREFLRIAMPRTPESVVAVYESRVPVFHAYGIEDQIESIHARKVPLKSGGSIVIDQTEALVAIDVNSGRLRNVGDEEETAYQTNIEAAQQIARQLRLRDLGGLVVCDFIDMRFDRHKRAVERELRNDLKKHKERARILRMSQFGLIELTRQRQGPSIKRGIYADCPHCKGSGLVKTPESMTLHVLRNIQKAVYHSGVVALIVTVSADVASELQNRKRAMLHQFESETGKRITIRANASFTWDQQVYEAEDTHGRRNRLFTDGD